MPKPLLLPPPLANILGEIKRSFDAKLYYPALVVALTLPEVCASMLLPASEFVRQKHYVKFLEDYADTRKLGVDPLTCYRLRGGLIHRADASGHPHITWGSHPVENVIFTVPETQLRMHSVGLRVGGHMALALILEEFLAELEAAVRRWYQNYQDDENVIERIWNILSWRPHGLPGFVSGVPVIASGPEQPHLRSALVVAGPPHQPI